MFFHLDDTVKVLLLCLPRLNASVPLILESARAMFSIFLS